MTINFYLLADVIIVTFDVSEQRAKLLAVGRSVCFTFFLLDLFSMEQRLEHSAEFLWLAERSSTGV